MVDNFDCLDKNSDRVFNVLERGKEYETIERNLNSFSKHKGHELLFSI